MKSLSLDILSYIGILTDCKYDYASLAYAVDLRMLTNEIIKENAKKIFKKDPLNVVKRADIQWIKNIVEQILRLDYNNTLMTIHVRRVPKGYTIEFRGYPKTISIVEIRRILLRDSPFHSAHELHHDFLEPTLVVTIKNKK